MTPEEFHAWSPEHFAALGVSALIAVVMILVGRSRHRRAARAQEIVFAVLLVAQLPLSIGMHWNAGTLNADNSYPCHFCDLAALSGVLALLTHRRFFVEMVYFWGLAGTLQGLITPALTLNWPHPRFVLFFIAHSGVIISALYCVIGLRITPNSSAKRTAYLLLFPFAAVVGLFDWIVGANYGFLCHKPGTASLYDVLGPWPWYILAAGMVGLTFFTLLDLPFVRKRVRDGEEAPLGSAWVALAVTAAVVALGWLLEPKIGLGGALSASITSIFGALLIASIGRTFLPRRVMLWRVYAISLIPLWITLAVIAPRMR